MLLDIKLTGSTWGTERFTSITVLVSCSVLWGTTKKNLGIYVICCVLIAFGEIWMHSIKSEHLYFAVKLEPMLVFRRH